MNLPDSEKPKHFLAQRYKKKMIYASGRGRMREFSTKNGNFYTKKVVSR
jgi:hypothetical protein